MLSKKFKTQLKKIAVNTILAVSAMVVLFVMCVNFDGRLNKSEDQVGLVNSQGVGAGNQVEVVKDSNGINVKVRAEDSSGVRSIEVLQGDTSVGTYTFGGSNAVEEKTVGLSIPFGETKDVVVKVNGNTIKQESVNNMRCISTAQDLAKFRDLVNAGDSFAGKSVELTNDIDLSSLCSSLLGSWQPIGGNINSSWKVFSGIFNGNKHQIKNIYINNTTSNYQGLFGVISGGIVRDITITGNMILKNGYSGGICGEIRGTDSQIVNCKNYVTISSTSGNDVAGICGFIGNAKDAVILDCENYANITRNGSANGYHFSGIVGSVQNTSNNIRIINCKNTGDISSQGDLSGILGYIRNATNVYVDRCCNFGTITAVDYCAAGMVGNLCDGGRGVVTNCYNKGTIKAGKGSSGGIVGNLDLYDSSYANPSVSISGCYNSSTLTCTGTTNGAFGGVLGYSRGVWFSFSNTYFETGRGATYSVGAYVTGGGTNYSGTAGVNAATLKGYVNNLGVNNWVADSYGINGGYPIFRWQVPSFELNVKQAYMHVGETLQLTADKSKSPVTLGSITWASMDSSIATVDSTGIVTAVGEGYTTVYAVESTYTIKAMAVIRVAKNGAVAIAQVSNGNYTSYGSFTVVLKEDGTVWSARK